MKFSDFQKLREDLENLLEKYQITYSIGLPVSNIADWILGSLDFLKLITDRINRRK